MVSNDTARDYSRPTVPPTTPPVIDGNASPDDAAAYARDDGDSDEPGRNPASFDRSREDEELQPGGAPDEVRPDKGDTDRPSAPDEIVPGQGDFDQPDSAPAETPPQPGEAPLETPLPPD
ncbi:conserved hypothetical protein [Altererythrobacter sp. B11]|uniref:hypothetical protein n=1 Tax=Altererythrobacter sp. B11 TaxID=2060312 RepID=UPI000DC72E64|nr:hypothetical protein [Altererythrobacter sp. B11]BBC74216.1 conserved hypothetical protein [Altererythrobacter sp. B11]